MSAAPGGPRTWALAGLVAGLMLSASTPVSPPVSLVLAAVPLALVVRRRAPPLAGAMVLALAATLVGLAVGSARLRSIEDQAFVASEGAPVTVSGFVEAVPRRFHGEVRVRIATAQGRLLVEAPEPVADLPVGHEVEARGRVRQPAAWERAHLERQGVAAIVSANAIAPTGARRGGVAYLVDRMRERAEVALGRGTPDAQASLLRGFVLGQDDRIDPRTVEDFQRSGLAHLLAVSGQNVLLLVLLALPLLALAGLRLRGRLLGAAILIAVYVPVAGAGPSIQRAGVMGAAAVVAALASRPASRWYAMLLAAAVTLALNPRAAGDIGWQLSFAAVIGITLWAAPLRRLLGAKATRGGPRRALAEGVAVTVAATVATAPMMAHHFERLSLASLPANLLALPAVAPVMWLGMLAAAAGQIAWFPVEPITGLAGLCSAYISQVAAWTAAPAWAQIGLPLASPWAVAGVYAAMLVLGWWLGRQIDRRRTVRARMPVVGRTAAAATAALAGLFLAGTVAPGDQEGAAALEVRVLDVGQGDSILLSPRRGDPILVDTGPSSAAVDERLAELGVERLAAVLITHDQDDHSGGLPAVLERVDVGRVLWAARDRSLAMAAGSLGVGGLAAGSVISSGGLHVEVIWPPRGLIEHPRPGSDADPNQLSVVTVASWRRFRLLLTADAEAEAVPIDPGPVDVLKLAHHGSADAGLGELLTRTTPRLAVASVGEPNPFGHPDATTLAKLAEADVPLLRTDAAGEIAIAVDRSGWSVLIRN